MNPGLLFDAVLVTVLLWVAWAARASCAALWSSGRGGAFPNRPRNCRAFFGRDRR